MLYAILCGTVPFKAPSMPELHKLILAGEFKYPVELSTDAKSMVEGLMRLEPTQRLTIPQIMAHAWLKETNEESEEEEEEENKDEKGEQNSTKESDVDLKNIGANINFVNVDNLFYDENYDTKLSYTDYCCITEDFTTHHIDEEALKIVEGFGYPRNFVVRCLNSGDLNHATASYYLLVMP